MDKYKLAIWVIVIASMVLKPFLKRRKERAEALKRTAAPPSAPEAGASANAAEPEDGDGPKLPYEDLVDEVFGPYISRRQENARPKPPAEPGVPPVPSRSPAPTFTASGKPPEPARAAFVAVSPSLQAVSGRSRTVAASAPAESASRLSLVDQRLFGSRRLAPAAKLVIAAEILRPPRILRERGGFWNR
ncbi:MAG TPA: hypothetical protein VKU80_18725 [Planctomycetota bacterium]|nr:hypothetical protein [Planctomycetota bacterium]